MKSILSVARACVAGLLAAAGVAFAEPPQAITIDWSAGAAPPLSVYRANTRTYDITFKNAGTPVNLTGYTPVVWWATNLTAGSIVTATVSVVSATAGTARATFSSADLNYAAGTYVYAAGLVSNQYATARHGLLVIRHDPYATGAGAVTFLGLGGNGAALTNLNASELRSGTVPLARLSAITSNEIAAATDAAYRNAAVTNLSAVTLIQTNSVGDALLQVQGNAGSLTLYPEESGAASYLMLTAAGFSASPDEAWLKGANRLLLQTAGGDALSIDASANTDFGGHSATNIATLGFDTVLLAGTNRVTSSGGRLYLNGVQFAP